MCMHVLMNLCIDICMYVCMYVRIRVCIYVYMYVCTYVYMYVCMSVYICMYVQSTYAHARMYQRHRLCEVTPGRQAADTRPPVLCSLRGPARGWAAGTGGAPAPSERCLLEDKASTDSDPR